MSERESRKGTRWTGDDYRELFTALASGEPDETVAARLDRTVRAVRKRAHLLLPEQRGEVTALRELRQMAADQGFDGMSLAWRMYEAKGKPFPEPTVREQPVPIATRSSGPSNDSPGERIDVAEQDDTRHLVESTSAAPVTEIIGHLDAAAVSGSEDSRRAANDPVPLVCTVGDSVCAAADPGRKSDGSVRAVGNSSWTGGDSVPIAADSGRKLDGRRWWQKLREAFFRTTIWGHRHGNRLVFRGRGARRR